MNEERFVSYAQNLEDVMLWRALHEAVGGVGFYIDVGAADPTALSVTRAFYDRGWRGMNLEPLPEQAALLAEARPRDLVLQAAAAEAEASRTFYRVTHLQQTGLSTFDAGAAERHRVAGAVVEAIEVPVVTLAAVCRAHVAGPVHFLKVDAEGAEAEVLAGADFAAVRPWVVVVEATAALTEAGSEGGWEPGLLAAGYRFVWFDGLNRFYLAEEQAGLARHFRVQPNVFDAYVAYDPVLRPYVEAVEGLVQLRGEAIEGLEAEVARLGAEVTGLQAAALSAEEEEAAAAALAAEEEAAAAAVPAPVVEVTPAFLVEAPPFASGASSGRRGLVRRLGRGLYGLVRPVVRPLAWRTRQFLTGDIRREIAEFSARQDQLLARPAASSTTVSAAVDPSFSGAMERLLLTLALEEAREVAPALLAPAAAEPGGGLSNGEPGG